MDDSMRSCRRTGCRWPAVASLSYRYDTRQVWLGDLGERHPSLYDLCPHHADTLTVPRGWERVDQRSPEPAAVAEPAGRDLVSPAGSSGASASGQAGAEVGHAVSRATGPRGGGSRYSVLRADLPRLAAELAGQRGGVATAPAPTAAEPTAAEPTASEQAAAEPRASAPLLRSVPSPPMPSRDLSPLPSPPAVAGTPSPSPPRQAELAGQLAIPVEGEAAAGEPRAVVVSFELAGSRRRSDHPPMD